MGGEDQLIKKLARAVPAEIRARGGAQPSSRSVRLGIGDDAAVLAAPPSSDLLITCDAFLEGVHFLASRHPPDSVGYKSLARATSDIAAMGGTPRLFLLTLALPKHRTGRWLSGFLGGMKRAAEELGMRLIGGDTTQNPFVFISITVLGEVSRGRAITRAGARAGDILYVTGILGRAQLGLEVIKNARASEVKTILRSLAELLRPHLYPRIRLGLAEWLAGHRMASSMIDLSDGLSTDLGHLCRASGVGARLWARQIPIVEIPKRLWPLARKKKLDPMGMALDAGDDYELLFTVPRRLAKHLRSAPEFQDLTAIGEIERGRRILWADSDGRTKPLGPGGWDPFR